MKNIIERLYKNCLEYSNDDYCVLNITIGPKGGIQEKYKVKVTNDAIESILHLCVIANNKLLEMHKNGITQEQVTVSYRHENDYEALFDTYNLFTNDGLFGDVAFENYICGTAKSLNISTDSSEFMYLIGPYCRIFIISIASSVLDRMDDSIIQQEALYSLLRCSLSLARYSTCHDVSDAFA